MDAVLDVNVSRADRVTARLASALGGLRGRRIGVLGLTYKPNTSTMRRAMSLDIIERLVGQGAAIQAYDPLANLGELASPPPLTRMDSPYAAAQGADALLLLTEWKDIQKMNLKRLRGGMKGLLFFDTRNLLSPKDLTRAGFTALGIGRGQAS